MRITEVSERRKMAANDGLQSDFNPNLNSWGCFLDIIATEASRENSYHLIKTKYRFPITKVLAYKFPCIIYGIEIKRKDPPKPKHHRYFSNLYDVHRKHK